MAIRVSKRGNSIRFTGKDARGWMVHHLVDTDGGKAHHRLADGPLKSDVLALMKERGITPIPESDENARDPDHTAGSAGQ